MEQEPKPENPFIGMSDEYLYGELSNLQEIQREINVEYSKIQAALTINYADRLRK